MSHLLMDATSSQLSVYTTHESKLPNTVEHRCNEAIQTDIFSTHSVLLYTFAGVS